MANRIKRKIMKKIAKVSPEDIISCFKYTKKVKIYAFHDKKGITYDNWQTFQNIQNHIVYYFL